MQSIFVSDVNKKYWPHFLVKTLISIIITTKTATFFLSHYVQGIIDQDTD